MPPLKEAISELHSKAEKMEFNQRMFAGVLTPLEYKRYLIQQLGIFTELESKSNGNNIPHDSLNRTDALVLDIEELNTQFNLSAIYVSKSTQDYILHLRSLDNASYNAHVYLNYLALVYGGQMIKTKVPGSGKFYEFDGDMKELVGSIRAIQNDEMAEEANKGLQYIINILDELQTRS
jgi:heme oxygenase